MPIQRLVLNNFRNYHDLVLGAGAGFNLLFGGNGSGKTNILEAVSLLTPGRGLRQVALSDIARTDGPGGFAIAAKLEPGSDVGTGTLPTTPDRRQVRINGTTASVNSLSEWLSVLWLTPAMDRLFTESAGGRRRFLDRLVLALEPGHASHAARYEAATRARNKLLADPDHADPDWLTALELGMAEHGQAVAEARARTVSALSDVIAAAPDAGFPRASLALEGWTATDLAAQLRANRGRDAAAGRTTEGPHRQDLVVTHLGKGQPAARGSTGEQKALLIGIILAHAALVAERRGAPPILLLDEVAAHLDPNRRLALFERLSGKGQVWMTATEPSLFEGITAATRFHVENGTVSAA
nr:DNA replication/repair protein RecF [uncultured Sphingomonas sp.]